MASSRLFADRADAGRRLAAALPSLEGDVLVLGLARVGVPVAAEVARELSAPLDVLVVRKVGHPAQPEYGLATGRSMAVALATVEEHGAARVVMAVPVAAGPGFRDLAKRHEVHALEVLEPPDFFAVGQFYSDFLQVGDDEVTRLLAESGGDSA